MKFHKQYCDKCKTQTLCLEKLKNPQDANCIEIVNICQYCNSKLVKNKKPVKLKVNI